MVSTRAVIVALVALSSSTVNGFWRQQCSLSQTGRVDPIISPGQVSSHVHKIAGGSNIGISSSGADMLNSACTTCEIQADKSGYWTPQLYYQHKNGSFEEVPNDGMTIYYLGRGDNRANIQPFPPGFKMVSGNPLARSYDNTTLTFHNATVSGRPLADRVSFACLDSSPTPETPSMVNTKCSNGLRAQIQFPSCWNGVDLYLENNAHVDYMSQIDNGVCSSQFPVQLAHLFYEVLYGVSQIDQTDGGRFMFAYGDPTGFGFHGDFLNGWDQTVLTQSLAQCINTDNAGQISACAPLAAVDTGAYAANCPEYAPNGAPLINETVRGMIGTTLPGCINIVNGPAWASVADISCAAGTVQPAVMSYPAQTPTNYLDMVPNTMVGLNGWKYLDCYTDLVNGTRVLSGTSTSGSSVSIENCQTYCSNNGYRFAGVENGNECYCSSIINTGNSNNQTGCSQVCAGNGTEYCGGPSRINIFNNTLSTATIAAPGAGATPASAGTYMGCATDANSNGRTLSGPSTSSSSMSLETCRAYCDAQGYYLSGTEYASQCYCGNALANGGAILSSNSSCNMVCSGSNTETCGGPSRLSVFSSTKIGAPVAASNIGTYQFQGCWVDNTNGQRALAADAYTNTTSMTPQMCVGYCSGKGYSYAGTEYSSQCFCGNSLLSGSNATLSDCGMLCAGDKSQTCGSGNRLSLYKSSAGPSVAVLKVSSTSTKSTSSTATKSTTTLSTMTSSVLSTSTSISSSSKTTSTSATSTTSNSSSSTSTTTKTSSSASATATVASNKKVVSQKFKRGAKMLF